MYPYSSRVQKGMISISLVRSAFRESSITNSYGQSATQCPHER